MSSAMNHMKRSHRSERMHHNAGMARKHRMIVSQANDISRSPLAMLGRLFRKQRETKSDIV